MPRRETSLSRPTEQTSASKIEEELDGWFLLWQLHVNDEKLKGDIYTLVWQRNKDDIKKVHKIEQILIEKAIELGGTMTGEHGIGLFKKNHLEWQLSGNVINAFKDIKEIFDTDNLFNPGKIVDLDIVKLLN